MPRKPLSPPLPIRELKTYDEANVARLGLISIQERIPDDYTTWTVEFVRDGRPSKLQCVASAEYGGVPHGLDGDVATAITDMFIESGAPEHGRIYTTAYRLLRRAGFPDSGHYYAALKRSLHRLRFAGYSASESWRDASRERWVTVTFTYLTGLNFDAEDQSLSLSSGSDLEITLAEPIVRSIRASYVKPIDYDFLRSLSRPLTRSLYRLLDARRYDPLTLGEPLTSLRVGLVAWAQECKIADKSPDKIRRTLQTAHTELLKRGYLQEVGFEGRGQKQELIYTFATDAPNGPREAVIDVDGEAMQALLARKISKPVAVRLIAEYGEEHVRERLQKAERILAGGYVPKNVSAFIVDVVKDAQGKYADPGAPTKSAEPAGAPARRTSTTVEMPEVPVQSVEELPHAAQVRTVSSTLKLLLRDHLSAEDFQALNAYLQRPEVNPVEISRTLLQAHLDGTLAARLGTLKRAWQAD